MLEVQKYLKTHTLDDLRDEYGIKVTRDVEAAPHLLSLNYNIMSSPKTHPITIECRGLILGDGSTNGNYNVMSRSLPRFFNYGEGGTKESIDFSKSVVYEKLDGSLIKFFYDGDYNKRWMVSTRGTTTARAAITAEDKGSVSYLKLIADALGIKLDIDFSVEKNTQYLDMERYNLVMDAIHEKVDSVFDRDMTYVFELVSPDIEVVVKYPTTKLYFISAIDVHGNESRLDSDLFEYPKIFDLNTEEDVMKLLGTINSEDEIYEGFVVHDMESNTRTKLKTSLYVKIHRSTSNGLDSHVLSAIVADSEEDEYLTYFPGDKAALQPYIDKREDFITKLQASLDKSFSDMDNGKQLGDIARVLKHDPLKNFVFPNLRNNERNARNAYSKMNTKSKVSLLS